MSDTRFGYSRCPLTPPTIDNTESMRFMHLLFLRGDPSPLDLHIVIEHAYLSVLGNVSSVYQKLARMQAPTKHDLDDCNSSVIRALGELDNIFPRLITTPRQYSSLRQ
jgi:hypothetical protein